jgi:hypothetical protein
MKRYLVICVLSALAFLIAVPPASAQMYVSAAALKETASSPRQVCRISTFDCTDETIGKAITLGHRLRFGMLAEPFDQLDNMSVEIRYASHGKLTTKAKAFAIAGPAFADSIWSDNLQSLSVGTSVEVPLYRSLNLVMRLGYSFFRSTEKYTFDTDNYQIGTSTRRTSEPYYALGLSYRLNRQVSLAADFMATKAPYGGSSFRDLRTLSAGAVYSF